MGVAQCRCHPVGRDQSKPAGVGLRVGGLPIVLALGSDVMGSVLCPSRRSQRHHRRPLAAALDVRKIGCGDVAGRCAQGGEEQRTARHGHIALPGRHRPDHGSVGQLLIAPAPEGFEQMVLSTALVHFKEMRAELRIHHPRR
jgi:hypothetical protein